MTEKHVRILLLLFWLFVLSCWMNSCNIEKRHFNNGYSIQWKKRSIRGNAPVSKTESPEIHAIRCDSTATDHKPLTAMSTGNPTDSVQYTPSSSASPPSETQTPLNVVSDSRQPIKKITRSPSGSKKTDYPQGTRAGSIIAAAFIVLLLFVIAIALASMDAVAMLFLLFFLIAVIAIVLIVLVVAFTLRGLTRY